MLAPNGVEEERGPGYVEYAIYGGEGELPELGELEAAAGRRAGRGRSRPRCPTTGPTAGRTSTSRCWSASALWLRPSWEEPREGAIDVVVDPGRAFGTGAHPTTRLCLELLLELEAAGEASGPLTDLGTGSGVLAIAAAKLGWDPVRGYDHEPPAIEAAAANAAANGVELELERVNLREGLPDLAPTVVANMTAPVLQAVAGQLASDRGRGGRRSLPAVAPAAPPRSRARRLVARRPSLPVGLAEADRRSTATGPLCSAATGDWSLCCCVAADRRRICFPPMLARSITRLQDRRSSSTSSRSCSPSGRPSATRSSSRSRQQYPRAIAGDPARRSRRSTATWSTRA